MKIETNEEVEIQTQSIAYLQNICKTAQLEVDFDALEYIDNFVADINEMQDAVERLKAYSKLMHMDIDLKIAKTILNPELLEEVTTRNKFQHVDSISFKYLFNDKNSEYHGKYFVYELVDGSLHHSSQNILIFKVENKQFNEIYEMKLTYKNNSFFITSDYLDSSDVVYELDYFSNNQVIVFYKNFGVGEMYLHMEYDKDEKI